MKRIPAGLLSFVFITILYINNDILNSFEKIDNPHNDKVWQTGMYSPQQNFFNSIWLTDKEYKNLCKYRKVETKYRQELLTLIIDE